MSLVVRISLSGLIIFFDYVVNNIKLSALADEIQHIGHSIFLHW